MLDEADRGVEELFEGDLDFTRAPANDLRWFGIVMSMIVEATNAIGVAEAARLSVSRALRHPPKRSPRHVSACRRRMTDTPTKRVEPMTTIMPPSDLRNTPLLAKPNGTENRAIRRLTKVRRNGKEANRSLVVRTRYAFSHCKVFGGAVRLATRLTDDKVRLCADSDALALVARFGPKGAALMAADVLEGKPE